MIESSYIWMIAVLLGLGTWLIRFSFLGLVGNRQMPLYIRQMLNYTTVAVLPGIAMPMVLNGVNGGIEPLRILAALALLAVGVWTQHMIKALAAGLLIYFAGGWFIG